MAALSFFEAAARFRLLAALLLICFCARAMAFRALQQTALPSGGVGNSLFPTPPTGVPSGLSAAPGAAPQQCPGVKFDASLFPSAVSSCTGPFLDQFQCCSAINDLWNSAAVTFPQAAQTLGVASIDLSSEQACLAATQQALAPLGVTIDLSQLCAGPLSLAVTPANTCPSTNLPPSVIQSVISACQNLPTPESACGPCFNALVGAINGLLSSAAPPPSAVTGALGPLTTGLTSGSTILDCTHVVLARILQQDPSFYRVTALLPQANNGNGCGSAAVATATAGA